jgi:hypothetical protein
MPRPCQRAMLECGLKFDINRAIREGWITPGAHTRVVLQWASHPAWTITANLTGTQRGYVRIQIETLDDWIELEARPRHFGGRQWFLLCPHTNRRAMVLWIPPGARSFACRQRWGRQVAYASQFLDRGNRAHRGQAKIKSCLCSIGHFDPVEWDLPPKPKWMRWRTYNRAVEKFDRYEAVLDASLFALVAKLMGRGCCE